ncbi:MAG: adenylate kinase [bacterium]|nr:adenylate kinase [bacterium]
MNEKKIIIMFGPQGSGKGTQAKILSEKLNLPHISTGDLFREAIANNSELGKKVKEVMAHGNLVSDELTFELLRKRIEKDDCKRGFILDGYPRTMEQIRLLDNYVEVSKVIDVEIADEEALKRLANRRQDPETGKIYNLYTAPKPAEEIKHRLLQREDDQPEAIIKRLKIYHQQADAVLKHYQDLTIKINGEQKIDEVAADILQAI